MKASILQRSYNMTDPELCMFVSNLVGFMTRDAVEFTNMGVVAGETTALETLGSEFSVFPDDGIIYSDVAIAIEDKIIVRDALFIAAKNVYNRALNKWGEKSARYKSFGSIGIINQNDLTFLFMCKRVHTQGNFYKTDLLSEGLTQVMLDDLEDKIVAFEDILNAIKDAESNRDMKTEERIEKGNELYSLVSKYCNIGKQIWENISEAKYNDYIIYSPGPGSLTAPEDLSFYFPGTMFTWSPVENATSYILQASIDGVDFFEIFSGAETEFVYIPVQTGWMWFRCRAHNDGGNGNWSTVLKNGYYPGPTLPAPSNLAVELVTGSTDSINLSFDEVPSANVYKIYRSTTNIGDVAGSFVYAGQSNTNSFIESLIHGHRYYYRATAENPHQASGNSGTVFIDIA